MGPISSPGIGSGLDVKSIVGQLVALEKAPLRQLQTQASSFQTKLSTFGTIKSQVAAMGDAAAKLSTSSGWNPVSATSSNAAAVGVTAAPGAPASSFNMTVSQLATGQTSFLNGIDLTIPPDSPAGVAASLMFNFGPGPAVPLSGGNILASDSKSTIADKINASAAGARVIASVLQDANGARVIVRSRETGDVSQFTIGGVGYGNSQTALNSVAVVNGYQIISASNRLTNAMPGMTIDLKQVTAQPVQLDVSIDTETIKKNVQTFVDSYNALSATLANATRFDQNTKIAGPLQGDATAVGLQNALRSMMRSETSSLPFKQLSDIGIDMKLGGQLQTNATKLNAALSNLEDVKRLFTTVTGSPSTEGFGLKLKRFSDGLLAADGLVTAKSSGIQRSIERNGREQDRVNDRAARVEKQLLQQYGAMDATLGRLNGLNSFVVQQVAMWSKN